MEGRILIESVRSCVIPLAQAMTGISGPNGVRSVIALHRGSLDVVLGAPLRLRVQTPREQDEVHAVLRGPGDLFHQGQREPFEPGDFLFVAAVIEHRFEDICDDLLIRQIFYGSKGGDIPA